MKKILATLYLLIFPTLAFAINIGDPAPDFELQSFFGDKFSLKENLDKIVVLEWTNPGCPFVKKHYQNGNMQKLQAQYREKGIIWLTINSTTDQHQDYLAGDRAEKNATDWKIEKKFMLDDHQGTVGKLYKAKSTPHFFIINMGKLVYQGAIDSDPDIFENTDPKVNYVTSALDSLIAGKKISKAETNPYGCSVKYKE